jgi:HEAT repeat protein
MTYFCPACWGEVSAAAVQCPRCHSDWAALDHRAFVDKVIAALHHPEPVTRQRAAFVLGELHAPAAVPAFDALLLVTREPFFACEMVMALGKIDRPEAEQLLIRALDHRSFLVREAAVQALVQRGGAAAALALQHATGDRSPSVRRLAREMQ